jgi:hypothetical protein
MTTAMIVPPGYRPRLGLLDLHLMAAPDEPTVFGPLRPEPRPAPAPHRNPSDPDPTDPYAKYGLPWLAYLAALLFSSAGFLMMLLAMPSDYSPWGLVIVGLLAVGWVGGLWGLCDYARDGAAEARRRAWEGHE